MQVKFTFILQPYWLSSADNYLADLLSRGKLDEFLAGVKLSDLISPAFALCGCEEGERSWL